MIELPKFDETVEAGSDPGPERTPTQSITEGGREFLAVRRFVLRVTDGPDQGALHSSSGDKVVIGTHESADLKVNDPAVSRLHTEIAIRDGHIVITDLRSRNGTRVNGVPIVQANLIDGALISIGHTRVKFELATDLSHIMLSSRTRFGNLVGISEPMRLLFHALEMAAASDSTVLLEGETGTGKELAARSIHQESQRSKGPFVVVDCSALASSVVESELFGHERGAFTDATTTRQGAFEVAAGGTIFIDEVGELPLELQPKLLRALEQRETKRLGSTDYVPFDARVIAATNRNLVLETNERRFRSDLYFRLAVIKVRLPPLRERVQDLPALVDEILRSLDAFDDPRAQAIREHANENLARHAWPGNVRELRNHIERSLAMGGDTPEPDAEWDPSNQAGGSRLPLHEAREKWTRGYLENLLRRAGNVAAAAAEAGVPLRTMYRLLKEHGLKKE